MFHFSIFQFSISKTLQHLFQSRFRIVLAEELLFELEFAMLDCGDADAVDIAYGAVGKAQAREDAQLQVLFLDVWVSSAKMCKAVAVDGVERALHLFPFAW